MAIYFQQFYQQSAEACVVDLTPPTFAGISGLTVGSSGQLIPSWSAGSDTSNPIRYEIYVQASTATGLFSLSNIAMVVTGVTSAPVYTLANGF
jgi:hypothetical protein